MTASTPERPADDDKKVADQNAIAQVEGEIRAFVRKDVVRKEAAPWRRGQQAQQADPPREIPVDNVNTLIGRISGQSTEQIDKLIADLENVRSLLRTEAERLQRDLLGYADMSQTAMTSIRVISDSVAQWKSTIGEIRPERT